MDEDIWQVLGKGLNISIAPERIPVKEIVVVVGGIWDLPSGRLKKFGQKRVLL